MSRARGEDGYVVAVTVLVLGIILAMAGAAVALAVRSMDTSNRDKRAARSLAAADAGLDVARYRLNRTLLATKKLALSDGTKNLDGSLPTLDCLRVEIVDPQLPPVVRFGMTLQSGEKLCPETQREPLGDGTSFSYQVANRFTLGAALPETLTRQVMATGHGPLGRKARILGTFRARVNAQDAPTTLFRLWRVVQCSAEPTDPADPFSGCPYTGP